MEQSINRWNNWSTDATISQLGRNNEIMNEEISKLMEQLVDAILSQLIGQSFYPWKNQPTKKQ